MFHPYARIITILGLRIFFLPQRGTFKNGYTYSQNIEIIFFSKKYCDFIRALCVRGELKPFLKASLYLEHFISSLCFNDRIVS